MGVSLGWALLAATPATSSAAPGLVFIKGALTGNSEVWASNVDGKASHRLASGDAARISPDGTMVAYSVDGRTSRSAAVKQVRVIPFAGGVSRVLTSLNLSESSEDEGRAAGDAAFTDGFFLTWSPDSRKLAVATTASKSGGLLVIDVASGTTQRVGGGLVGSATFSPDSNAIADVSFDGYLNIADLGSGQLQRSAGSNNPGFAPTWGPSAISFVTARSSIATVQPDGRGYRRLALRKQILEGGRGVVQVLGWNGGSIMVGAYCELGCRSRLVAIDAATGAIRELRKITDKRVLKKATIEYDITVPVALSRDGTTVLGQRLAFKLKITDDLDFDLPIFDLQVVEFSATGSDRPRAVANGVAPDWNL